MAGPEGASGVAGLAGPDGLSGLRDRIRAGEDPLGEAFCLIRTPRQRRRAGQTFTPAPVVDSMVRWAARTLAPARVVDPGAGSARFLAAAGRRWPDAELVGLETDPLAALIARATLAAAGMAERAVIHVADYRSARLPAAPGATLFLGNPPYAAPGDAGALVTAAEWLDVNYGSLIRALLLGPLGGESVHLLDPVVAVFPDAAATSVITCFRPGTRPLPSGCARWRRSPASVSLPGEPRCRWPCCGPPPGGAPWPPARPSRADGAPTAWWNSANSAGSTGAR